MLLTVEYNSKGVVELAMDEEGRELLIRSIQRLSLDKPLGSHDHLMTKSWAGTELTEEIQNPENELINQLNIYLVRHDNE